MPAHWNSHILGGSVLLPLNPEVSYMCVCTSTCGEVRVRDGGRGKEEGREGEYECE